MSVTRARFTRLQEPALGPMVHKLVFFEDDLTPPISHVLTVATNLDQLHNMRTPLALNNHLIAAFQWRAQGVPGDQATIRALIKQTIESHFNAG